MAEFRLEDLRFESGEVRQLAASAGLFASLLAADEPTLRLHDLCRETLETCFARERPEQFRAVLARRQISRTQARLLDMAILRNIPASCRAVG